MGYQRFGSGNGPAGKAKGTIIALIGLLAAVAFFLIILITFFIDMAAEDIDDVEMVEVVEESTSQIEEQIPSVNIAVEEIELHGSEGFTASGIARRGVENGIFTHVVVADLPAINTDAYFYEGWLVRPGVTEFFSTGAMFPREDGKWGLVYDIELDDRDDVYDFYRVILTREPFDNDPAPDVHVAEGDFVN